MATGDDHPPGKGPSITELRRLRPLPSPEVPQAPGWDPPGPREAWLEPPRPTLAVLRGREGAGVEPLLGQLLRLLTAQGERPALLWCELSAGLDPGVATVGASPALLPEALRAVAGEAWRTRVAHTGPGGLPRAAEGLLRDLGEATHLLVDGRLLGVLRAHVAVLVTGDPSGALLPEAQARRHLCDMEVDAPSEAIAVGLLRALARRA